jgi:hypothetical protein
MYKAGIVPYDNKAPTVAGALLGPSAQEPSEGNLSCDLDNARRVLR